MVESTSIDFHAITCAVGVGHDKSAYISPESDHVSILLILVWEPFAQC